MNNIIKLTDSYKLSHFNQYPKGTETIHSYMSSRGGEYEELVFFGLTYYLKKYLSNPITNSDVLEAERNAIEHGIPFNKEGWDKIIEKHSGYLPITIKALPEESIFTVNEPVLIIENNDPDFFWLSGYLETLLMKIWYPITIATKSFHTKKMLKGFWNKTSDNVEGVDFSFHNFGDRGSSSVESAAIGGVAHLTQFKGTDNFNCLDLSKQYYENKYQGFSIPASEHSTVTSWGRDKEFKMIENYLETYKKSNLIACVLDSYDIYKAVDFVTKGKMKDKIESNDYPIFVIRPDSGEPIEVIEKILKIIWNNGVQCTENHKGYTLLNKYRVIWGDGVTPEQIKKILDYFCNGKMKLSAENFAFGSGGDLMQNVNRDTCKFAIKASSIKVDGEWKDVYKDPITDPGKKSLRGKQENERFNTVFYKGKVLV